MAGLLRKILQSRADLYVHTSHCALFDGLPVPYCDLTLTERRFLISCVKIRGEVWQRRAEGRNGELACADCVWAEAIERYGGDGAPDPTWRRTLARDACIFFAQQERSELLVALQTEMRSACDQTAPFVAALHCAAQADTLERLPAWGLHKDDEHPLVRSLEGNIYKSESLAPNAT